MNIQEAIALGRERRLAIRRGVWSRKNECIHFPAGGRVSKRTTVMSGSWTPTLEDLVASDWELAHCGFRDGSVMKICDLSLAQVIRIGKLLDASFSRAGHPEANLYVSSDGLLVSAHYRTFQISVEDVLARDWKLDFSATYHGEPRRSDLVGVSPAETSRIGRSGASELLAEEEAGEESEEEYPIK